MADGSIDEAKPEKKEENIEKDKKQEETASGEVDYKTIYAPVFDEVVGFAGEDLIAIDHRDEEGWIICSVDGYGEVTELGNTGGFNGVNPRAEQLLYVDGDIYLCLAYYEGTGHFLSKWEAVKATPGIRGNCSIVQEISSDFNTVFVIYADAVEDPEYDIGWRTGYRMTGWHIVAIPCGYDHLDNEGHANEIIHFEE